MKQESISGYRLFIAVIFMNIATDIFLLNGATLLAFTLVTIMVFGAGNLPETILAAAYSIHRYKNFIELSYYFSEAHFLYLSFQIGLPLMIWVVFILRKWYLKRLS